MTQAAQPAPAPAPAPTAPATHAAQATPGAPAPAADAEARLRDDVPRLLNRLQVLAVAACVVFGVLAAVVQVMSWQADGRAADNTEQVVRVQEIQSQLLRADAVATNGYLVEGLESPEQRAAYDEAIDRVLALVAEAAEAQPADRAALADLNQTVTAYTTAVSQARDYNRQRLPIGIAYLNDAGTTLRSDALPVVRALVDANSDRAVDEMEGQHPWWLLGLGALAVVALFLVNRTIAQRFHRRVNVGVGVAAVLVAVTTLVAAAHAQSKASDNDDTRAGTYRTAVDEASARSAANDAKAAESLGLVNRGSGAVFEESTFAPAAEQVQKAASPRTLRLWNEYLAQHQRIRDLDQAGRWEDAVALATSTDPGAPTALLDETDANADRVTTEAAAAASDAFRSGGVVALLLVALTLLAGLAAAGAATWGVNQRRREYA